MGSCEHYNELSVSIKMQNLVIMSFSRKSLLHGVSLTTICSVNRKLVLRARPHCPLWPLLLVMFVTDTA